jgi:hypothetical protein
MEFIPGIFNQLDVEGCLCDRLVAYFPGLNDLNVKLIDQTKVLQNPCVNVLFHIEASLPN